VRANAHLATVSRAIVAVLATVRARRRTASTTARTTADGCARSAIAAFGTASSRRERTALTCRTATLVRRAAGTAVAHSGLHAGGATATDGVAAGDVCRSRSLFGGFIGNAVTAETNQVPTATDCAHTRKRKRDEMAMRSQDEPDDNMLLPFLSMGRKMGANRAHFPASSALNFWPWWSLAPSAMPKRQLACEPAEAVSLAK
jgi:hypothetical protein